MIKMINHVKALECRRRWRFTSRETIRRRGLSHGCLVRLTHPRLARLVPAGEGQDVRGDRERRQSD